MENDMFELENVANTVHSFQLQNAANSKDNCRTGNKQLNGKKWIPQPILDRFARVGRLHKLLAMVVGCCNVQENSDLEPARLVPNNPKAQGKATRSRYFLLPHFPIPVWYTCVHVDGFLVVILSANIRASWMTWAILRDAHTPSDSNRGLY